ncbi:MAG TPA: NAD(+)/NADH kinase [bacterium]|nr:NAD(+)/NADH kinase [bacterium]HMW35137.1 NAD(+)/NADH kinase [bacterium]HMY37486.1 NAD(+)/NADH kinase [bacterium]HMZ04938.1 NAD(+)/NADH kinase [bacterium]HNB58540.1 NAD(+)/NADH kinase [bacterium]
MRLGIIINTEKESVIAMLPDFLEWLTARHYKFMVNTDAEEFIRARTSDKTVFADARTLVEASDVLISFGGDGTLLSTAKMVGTAQKPILGVNVGKLGFLTEIETKELHHAIERLHDGKYTREKRMVLEITLGTRTFYALNDAVIMRGNDGRVIQIGVDVNNAFLNNYIADGLIIATPTGSTAYSLSANGPIMSPTIEAIIINPICPHTLTMRPLVINSEHDVRLTLRSEDRALVSIDGVVEAELSHNDTLIIREAKHFVHLVRFGERNFFDVLRGKLHWGEDDRVSSR